jgi:hypothetical protein
MPLAKIRKNISNRLTERRAHRQLSAELASFQTPSERAELDEMLSRYPVEETRQIREILGRQDVARQRATTVMGVAGHRGW